MFTLKEYRKLLNSFAEAEYDFCLFGERLEKTNCVYLRHDIDFCIEYALPIATIEKDLNIRSTFFVLMNSKLYNLFDDDNIRTLKKISEMGHMICMHVDERYVTSKEVFLKQMNAFTSMLPFAYSRFISRHRPQINSNTSTWLPVEYIDVYCDSYFKNIEYASDSRGEWKYGYPTQREAFVNKKSFQLLTHPLWWVYDDEIENKKKIKLMLDKKSREAEQSLNFLNYK